MTTPPIPADLLAPPPGVLASSLERSRTPERVREQVYSLGEDTVRFMQSRGWG